MSCHMHAFFASPYGHQVQQADACLGALQCYFLVGMHTFLLQIVGVPSWAAIGFHMEQLVASCCKSCILA